MTSTTIAAIIFYSMTISKFFWRLEWAWQSHPPEKRLVAKLHEHGDKSDLLESRAAFAEKRAPNFKGWLDPADRYRMPDIEQD